MLICMAMPMSLHMTMHLPGHMSRHTSTSLCMHMFVNACRHADTHMHERLGDCIGMSKARGACTLPSCIFSFLPVLVLRSRVCVEWRECWQHVIGSRMLMGRRRGAVIVCCDWMDKKFGDGSTAEYNKFVN